MTDPTAESEQGERWEYHIEYISARAERDQEFLKRFYPPGSAPKYAVQSILPRLNLLGEKGWELVQVVPVVVGTDGNVMISDGESRQWANVYMCAFKRRKR